MLHDIADPLFGKKVKNVNYAQSKSTGGKANWMSEECCDLRNDYLQALNVHRAQPTAVTLENMKHARNVYNKAARKCRLEYDRNAAIVLVKNRTENAK